MLDYRDRYDPGLEKGTANVMLRTVVDRSRLTRAQRLLKRSIAAASATKMKRNLGWQGGGREVPVWSVPSLELWVGLGEEPNRYWNALGLGDPQDVRNLSIVVEINPPKHGLDRRISGAVVQDEDGVLYLAHRGKVAGGRPGIGKNAFMKLYDGLILDVEDGDRKSSMIVIGALEDPHLCVHIARFVRDVKRFKTSIEGNNPHAVMPPKRPRDSYSREFAGVVEVSPTKNVIIARVTHGHVVEALRAALQRHGIVSFNDRNRDLYCRDFGGDPALFEVKTNTDSQSLYTAIGQLFYHGAEAKCLIAVLPEPISRSVRARFRKLGLWVLGFKWIDNVPRFALARLLEEAGVSSS